MQRTAHDCNVLPRELQIHAASVAWWDAEKRHAAEQPQAPAIEAGEHVMYRAVRQLEAWHADGIITAEELSECIYRLWLT